MIRLSDRTIVARDRPLRPVEKLPSVMARSFVSAPSDGPTPLLDATAASKLLGVPSIWLLAQACRPDF
jgi:hypothetical protein